jgi:hypothetical protein
MVKSSSQVQRKINFLVLSKVVYYTDMINWPAVHHTVVRNGVIKSKPYQESVSDLLVFESEYQKPLQD